MKSRLVFESPPFGIVTIKEGQLGYLKKTRIRLKNNTKYGIHFETKCGRYVQDKDDEKIFYLDDTNLQF